MDVTSSAERRPCMMVLITKGVQRRKFVFSLIRLKIEIITITTSISGLTINKRSKIEKKIIIMPGNSGEAVAGIWLPIRNVMPTTAETNRQNPLYIIGIQNKIRFFFIL